MADITNVILDTSGFLPQVWAAEALPVLRRVIRLAKLITRDVDMGEAGWKGKQLNIPYPGTFAAQAKAVNTPAVVQVPTGGASVPLTLNSHQTVDFLLEDFAQAQASTDIMMRYIEPAIIALAEKLETDLYTMVSSSTGGTVGTPGTNLNAATLLKARQILNQQKAPQSDRYAIFSTKDEIGLIQDTTLQNYFAFSRPQDLEEGQLGNNLAGFTPFMSQFVDSAANYNDSQIVTINGTPTGGTFTLTVGGQTTSGIAYNAAASAVQSALVALSTVGTGNATVTGSAGGPYTVTFINAPAALNALMTASGAGLTGGSSPSVTVAANSSGQLATYNVAFHKSAFIMAMRPFAPVPDGSGVATATITDAESGIALRVLKQYSIQYRSEYVAFDILYGFTPLRPSLSVVMLS